MTAGESLPEMIAVRQALPAGGAPPMAEVESIHITTTMLAVIAKDAGELHSGAPVWLRITRSGPIIEVDSWRPE